MYIFLYLIIFVAISSIFFSGYIFLTPDSVQYLSYLDFFYGYKNIGEWLSARGFSMPFILWLGDIITPNNSLGTLIVFFSIYIIFIYCVYGILSSICKLSTIKDKYVCYCCILVFFIMNPMLYTYSHTLLTEFPVLVLSVILLYYDFIMYIKRCKNCLSQCKYVFYLLVNAFIIFILYNFKSMYMPIGIIIFISFEIMYCLNYIHRYNSFKEMIIRTCIHICSVILISTSLINFFISCTDKSVKLDTPAIIIGGMRYFEIEGYEHKDGVIQINNYLDGRKKINVMNAKDVIKVSEYTFEKNILNHMGFLYFCMKENGIEFIKSYVDNYMLLSNMYSRPWDIGGEVQYQTGYVNKDVIGNIFSSNGINNISQETRSWSNQTSNGMNMNDVIKMYDSNHWKFWNKYVYKFSGLYDSKVHFYINKIYNLYNVIYVLIVFFSPIVLFMGIRKNGKYNYNNKFYVLCTVIYMVIVSQLLMYTITGAVIDRYMFVSYMLGLINISIYVLKKITDLMYR